MNHTRTALLLICVAALTACGKQPTTEAAPAAASAPPTVVNEGVSMVSAPPVVPQRVPDVDPVHAEGKRVFDKTCGLCHAAGFSGAPRPADKANWAPRIAQGMDTLYQHALLGYSGSIGYMPPRGGAALSDAEVKAATDYMVALSR